VHMLSAQAFNALLKTLEEPPSHAKFIFATTDIRKVPVTVLSRCQRFDLRRVDATKLADFYAKIAASEGVKLAPGALALIARAADGSVRDGLSLLDRALALAEGEIGEQQVRDMMGLADRGQIFDLFDLLMKGEAAPALALLADLYQSGADPALLLQDLLDLTHWLTRIKLVPETADDPTAAEIERRRGREMAGKLSLPVLARCWQMLLKGLGETQNAPAPLQAAEMALIRLMHAGEMPPPGELVRRLLEAAPTGGPNANQSVLGSSASAPSTALSSALTPSGRSAIAVGESGVRAQPAPVQATGLPAPTLAPMPESFLDVVSLADSQGDLILRTNLARHVHLVRFETGRIELRPSTQAPANLANRLGQRLTEWTGRRWVVSISGEAGAPTLEQQAGALADAARAEVMAHPLVRAALEAFPGSTIDAIRELAKSAEADLPAEPALQGDQEQLEDGA
jgi:DNA polymerase III subunit gamma/tau